MTERAPAGWYPDSTGTVRWWDGEQWTEHQPPPPPPTQDAPTFPPPDSSAETPHGEADYPAAASMPPRERTSAGDQRILAGESPSRLNQDPPGSGKGLAMTALGVAIVSLLLCWIPIVNNAVFFLGVIGLVVAVIAYRRARKGKAEGRGMAFAAILISVLSLVGVLATQAFTARSSMMLARRSRVAPTADPNRLRPRRRRARRPRRLQSGRQPKLELSTPSRLPR